MSVLRRARTPTKVRPHAANMIARLVQPTEDRCVNAPRWRTVPASAGGDGEQAWPSYLRLDLSADVAHVLARLGVISDVRRGACLGEPAAALLTVASAPSEERETCSALRHPSR